MHLLQRTNLRMQVSTFLPARIFNSRRTVHPGEEKEIGGKGGGFFPFSGRVSLCSLGVHDAFAIVFLNESSRKRAAVPVIVAGRAERRSGIVLDSIGDGELKGARLHCISLLP